MIAAALAATLQLALGQTLWEAEARSEVRVLQGDTQDLVLEPRAALEHRPRDLMLRASYSPYVLFRRIGGDPIRSYLLHRADAAAELSASRDTQLRLGGSLSVGSSDYSWAASAPDSPPSTVTFRLGESVQSALAESATLSVGHAFSRELHVGASAGFALAGALHDADVATLPRTQTFSGAADVAYTIRRDAWFVGGTASHTTSTGNLWSNSVGGTASWRHAFSAASEHTLVTQASTPIGEPPPALYESELGAGYTYVGGAPTQAHGGQPTAWGSLLRITQRRTGAWGGRLTLRYAPQLDATTGLLTQRGEGSLRAELRLDRDVLATLAGGLAYAKDPAPPTPTWSGQGGLLVDWDVARWVRLGAQLRLAWLPDPNWAALATATFATHGRL